LYLFDLTRRNGDLSHRERYCPSFPLLVGEGRKGACFRREGWVRSS
jgi:hypothetical protein